MRRNTLALLLLALVTAVAADCSSTGAPDAAAGGAAADPGGSEPVARIGGEAITTAELDAWIKDELFRRETESSNLFEVRQENLDSMISRRLLDAEAAKLGLSADELLDQEAAKRVDVTEVEVAEFYEQNKARMGEATLPEMLPRIRAHLERQQAGTAVRSYVDELKAAAGVEILLEVPRIEVAATGPAIGPEDATVTIVEFSDYQCPYCRRAEPVIAEVLERYDGKVRFVYRHFPLDRIHPNARPAAEAAVCADAQGSFWAFHEKLWEDGADLGPEGLTAIAGDLELDADAFAACLDDPATKASVEADYQAGQQVGVSGTPAFFINGIRLQGAQPVEEFARIIDAELAAPPSGT